MKSTDRLQRYRSRSPAFLIACASALLWLGGCSRFQLLNATVPHCGYTRTRDIAYGPDPRQRLDVYRPTYGKPKSPVVVFFYGGDWQTGKKGDYRFVAQALASRGFEVILPDYRLYPAVRFPSFVEDGALAVRWTRENVSRFGGDRNRICLMGHSAGAHIAALLTLDAHYLADVSVDRTAIRATVALSGPYDFLPAKDDRAVFGMTETDTAPNPLMEPIHFVDGTAQPMLLIHGLKDQTVDPGNTSRLAERISSAGGEVRTILYPNRAHVGVVLAFAWPFRWLAPVLDDSTAFFRMMARPSAEIASPPSEISQ